MSTYNVQDLTSDSTTNKKQEEIVNEIENESDQHTKNPQFIESFLQNDTNPHTTKEQESDMKHLVEEKEKELFLLKSLYEKKVEQFTEMEKENMNLKISLSEKSNEKKSVNLNDELFEKIKYFKTQNSILKERIKKINILEDNQAHNHNEDLKTSDDLTSEHDDLIRNLEFNFEDPFKIFLNIIEIFNEIKDLLKNFSNYLNRYYYKLNISQQEDDDIIFYRSIILDSKKYFINCHKIREKKLVYDLNKIFSMIEDNQASNINEISKYTYTVIRSNYKKLSKDVKTTNKNSNNKLHWIKNDKLKYIETIKREMFRCFSYHLEVNQHYLDSLISEMKFYNIGNED
tara:strand:+ start:29 stop:1060 length:1032 start_codon:yes stop_codon:yes gene_type:complete